MKIQEMRTYKKQENTTNTQKFKKGTNGNKIYNKHNTINFKQHKSTKLSVSKMF